MNFFVFNFLYNEPLLLRNAIYGGIHLLSVRYYDAWYNIPPVLHQAITSLSADAEAHRRALDALRRELKEGNEAMRRVMERSTDAEVEMRKKHSFSEEYWKKRVGRVECQMEDLTVLVTQQLAAGPPKTLRKFELLLASLQGEARESSLALAGLGAKVERQEETLITLCKEQAKCTSSLERIDVLTTPLYTAEADIRVLQEEIKSITSTSKDLKEEIQRRVSDQSNDLMEQWKKLYTVCMDRVGSIQEVVSHLNTVITSHVKTTEKALSETTVLVDGLRVQNDAQCRQLSQFQERMEKLEVDHSRCEEALRQRIAKLEQAAVEYREAKQAAEYRIDLFSTQLSDTERRIQELTQKAEMLERGLQDALMKVEKADCCTEGKKRWGKVDEIAKTVIRLEAKAASSLPGATSEPVSDAITATVEACTASVSRLETAAALHDKKLKVLEERFIQLTSILRGAPATGTMRGSMDASVPVSLAADLRTALLDVESLQRRVSLLECHYGRWTMLEESVTQQEGKVQLLEGQFRERVKHMTDGMKHASLERLGSPDGGTTELDRAEAANGGLLEYLKDHYYQKDEMEVRLENMWASVVSLLAQKQDRRKTSEEINSFISYNSCKGDPLGTFFYF
eukprot:gene3986-2841_t